MGLKDTISKLRNLDAAITNALDNEVATAAIDEIQKTMDERVYSDAVYTPQPIFLASRRRNNGGLRDANNFSHDAKGDTLTIDIYAELQNLFYPEGEGRADNLATIVQEGTKEFFQPFPRPFMEEAKTRFISSGRAEAALIAGLQRQGIDTQGLSFTFE